MCGCLFEYERERMKGGRDREMDKYIHEQINKYMRKQLKRSDKNRNIFWH